MHGLKAGQALLTSAVWLLTAAGNSSAAAQLEIEVVSGRPEMVSGGSALVELRGAPLDGIRVVLNGRDVTRSFRPAGSSGPLLARLEGLKLGPNLLEASAGGSRARLRLVNHPIAGPVFSGPHQQPFICQTEFSGLGKAVDADCSAPTRVEYFYRSTDPLRPEDARKPLPPGALAPGFKPLNISRTLPPDVATTTTTGGRQLHYIVRLETGTINRGVYRIAFLHEPGQPLPDPWTQVPGWNRRLVYSFGGGCRTGFRQGQVPPPIDLNALSAGYAVAGSTLNVFGNNANDVINAETLMMVKDYFIRNFGVPVHTIGVGGSGGAIQQYLIAQNYPGLLDGITPGASFADVTSVGEVMLDCSILARAFDAMRQPLTADQRLAVAGYGAWGLCESRNKSSPQWMQAGACDASMPRDKVYDPVTNPKGVRCSLQDNQANIYGRDPRTGAAPQIFDNVGVQYGLRPFNEKKIGAGQFLELNQLIGGFDPDGNPGPARSAGDRRALQIAYQTGRVNTGAGGLGSLPIIDHRRYADTEGNPHDKMRSAQMRLRIERAHGSAANQVILTNPVPGVNVVRLMDQWLDRIAADKSQDSPQRKVARNKPDGLEDACWSPGGEKIPEPATFDRPGRCNQLYPSFADPRIVAGSPVAADVMKCTLKPIDPKDYKQPLTAEQLARLRKIFPQGVCDYSRPGVGQTGLRQTWISYAGR
jgi:hypothetical protein